MIYRRINPLLRISMIILVHETNSRSIGLNKHSMAITASNK